MIENLFLCVGAQKSGTTWLHAQLENHPEIGFPPNIKEVHYFNTIHQGGILLSRRRVNNLKKLVNSTEGRSALQRYFIDISRGHKANENIRELLSPVDDEWYIGLFKDSNKKYAADFTPEYALLPKEGFEHIKQVSREQKIIFLMRDPVSRTKSAIQYYFQRKGIEPSEINDDMVWDISKKDFFINFSKYDITIKTLESQFDKSQLKFMFFEDLMDNKQKAIDEICDFLNIARVELHEEKVEKKVNASTKINLPHGLEDKLEKQFQDTYSFMHEHFESLPEKWRC